MFSKDVNVSISWDIPKLDIVNLKGAIFKLNKSSGNNYQRKISLLLSVPNSHNLIIEDQIKCLIDRCN